MMSIAVTNEHLKNQLMSSLSGIDYLITEGMDIYKRLKEYEAYQSTLRHQSIDKKSNMMDLIETLQFLRDCYSLKAQIIAEAKDNENEYENEESNE